jgi:hypothetical protein
VFERYTEKARRAIFFGRYEASRYGSPYIETEHLLLGLLREDRTLTKWFPGVSNVEPGIRAEIEKGTTQGKWIPTSVEIPLSEECKKVLFLAAETSERLGHDQIEPEHLLIGILRVETSRAAQILVARGLKPGPILERIGKATGPKIQDEDPSRALLTLEAFLSGLKSLNSEDLILFFAKNAQFIDADGKRWNRNEIRKGFETLFAPYGKKNASYVVEATLADTGWLFVANVRWNNAFLPANSAPGCTA